MRDNNIIELIKLGDKTILEKVYTKHRDEFITWLTTKYNISLPNAKDIYQQCIVIFYENIVDDKIDRLNSSIKTYLFAIGKNIARQDGRESSRTIEFADTIKESLIDIVDEDYDIEALLKQVKSSLIKLGDPCKALLELHYYHKKSMEEISQELNYKNSSTTKNLKYKCLLRLRKIFHEESKLQNGLIYG